MINFRFLVEQLLIETTIRNNSILDPTVFAKSDMAKATNTHTLDFNISPIIVNALRRQNATELSRIYQKNPDLLYITDMLGRYADELVKNGKGPDVPSVLSTTDASLSAAKAEDLSTATFFKSKNPTAPDINVFKYNPISPHIIAQWELVKQDLLKTDSSGKVYNSYLGAEKSKTVVEFVEENSGLDISEYESDQKKTLVDIQASDKALAGPVGKIAVQLVVSAGLLQIPYMDVKIEDLLKNVSVHAELLESLKTLVLYAAQTNKWAKFKKEIGPAAAVIFKTAAKLGMAPGTR